MNKAERAHIDHVANVFRTYGANALSANDKRRRDFDALPLGHRALLCNYPSLLQRIDQCIRHNALLLTNIACHAGDFLQLPNDQTIESDDSMSDVPQPPDDSHYERLRSVMRQIAREWSASGSPERELAFLPILDRLERFSDEEIKPPERRRLQVLVPGAGLGRLVWEVANRGFAVTGNECSIYMLLAGNAILNSSGLEEHIMFPFIHSLSNVVSADDILSPERFSDVDPSSLVRNGSMAMAAGDFVEVYQRSEFEGAFDCIITCFFIDTAANLCEYLDTIRHALAQHGIWINLGPLLWHHENSQDRGSLELTLEDVKSLCQSMGFTLEDERFVKSGYTTNQSSMLVYSYTAAYWCARKVSVTP